MFIFHLAQDKNFMISEAGLFGQSYKPSHLQLTIKMGTNFF